MDRRTCRLIAIAVVLFYVTAVAWLACWKLALGLPDARAPWIEIVFGPLLTLASSFLLFLVVTATLHLASAFKNRLRSRPRTKTPP